VQLRQRLQNLIGNTLGYCNAKQTPAVQAHSQLEGQATCPDSTWENRIQARMAELARSELAIRRWSGQLQELSKLSARLNTAHDVGSILGVVVEGARGIIGVHQAVASVDLEAAEGQQTTCTSLSEKYAHWSQGQGQARFGTDALDGLVKNENQTLRLAQAELQALPQGMAATQEDERRPAMRGWLAAPFVRSDGGNLGLVQLSDKTQGEFTEADEMILAQLAQTASVALENARLYQDLRDRDQRKDDFLAMLAHELRNPLAPIRNAVQILLLAHPNDDTVSQAREVIGRQVTHLVRLVDDLLDVSRITRGKINLVKGPVEISMAIAVAVESCRPLLDERRHTFELNLAKDSLYVRADLTRLTQVLLNLLNNAAKYTDAGGRIQLTVAREDDTAVIRVRDNGTGIAPQVLPTIFDVFTQVDRTLDRAQGGLGLGLTLVRRLTEMHGGTVDAHSDGLGKGSTFTVRLPLLTEYRTQASAVETGPPPGACLQEGNARVLVVDDSSDSAESLAVLLRGRGYQVRTVHDGNKALPAAEEFRPEVFVLDIGLPGLDGFELARRFRMSALYRDALLISLTGYGTEEDRRTCFQAGFDAHFVKPLDLNSFFSLLGSFESMRPGRRIGKIT